MQIFRQKGSLSNSTSLLCQPTSFFQVFQVQWLVREIRILEFLELSSGQISITGFPFMAHDYARSRTTKITLDGILRVLRGKITIMLKIKKFSKPF